jgi:hypothetical protein
MNDVERLAQALIDWGLEWDDVWRLALDRRAETVTVITADGRKLTAALPAAATAAAPRAKVKLVK